MRFFFDNCISPKLARAIHALESPEHQITGLRERWPASVDDATWIPALAKDGDWIVISGDRRIATRPRERELWLAAKLTTFFMADGFVNVDRWEQIRWMLEKWPLIVKQSMLVKPGAAFVVPKRGNQLQQL